VYSIYICSTCTATYRCPVRLCTSVIAPSRAQTCQSSLISESYFHIRAEAHIMNSKEKQKHCSHKKLLLTQGPKQKLTQQNPMSAWVFTAPFSRSLSQPTPPLHKSMHQFSSLELRSSTHSSRARIANRMSPSDFLLAYVTLVERSAKARFLWRNKHVKRDLNRF